MRKEVHKRLCACIETIGNTADYPQTIEISKSIRLLIKVCTKERREKGEGRREKGEGRREKGEGRREKGEGRREKGEGRREKGEGRGEERERREKREETI